MEGLIANELDIRVTKTSSARPSFIPSWRRYWLEVQNLEWCRPRCRGWFETLGRRKRRGALESEFHYLVCTVTALYLCVRGCLGVVLNCRVVAVRQRRRREKRRRGLGFVLG